MRGAIGPVLAVEDRADVGPHVPMLTYRLSTASQVERRCRRTIGIDVNTNNRGATNLKPPSKLLQQRRTDTLPPVLSVDVEVLQLSVAVESPGFVSRDVADDSVIIQSDVSNSCGKRQLRMVASFEVCDHATIGRTDNCVTGAAQCHARYIGDRRLSVFYQAQKGVIAKSPSTRIAAQTSNRNKTACILT